ncbi:MAG: penicillin acylase family protein, partial [Acidimicrobiia bacterium]|nr:penicillin acylase family protein [Acidimicrobiia bacterium]
PIISGLFGALDDMEEADTGYPDDYAVALAWQTLEPSTLIEAILDLNVASDWDEFRSAMSLWDIAAQNVVYADTEGNIGYQSTGEIPIRANSDGLRPVPGWDSSYDWTGLVPFDEMPYIFNPERGYVATANQPVMEVGALPFIGSDGAYGYRAARIEEMINEADAPLTVAAIQEMQMDTKDGGALDLAPALLAVDSDDDAVNEMQGLIEQFAVGIDGFRADTDSAGAAAYEATWRALLRLTFHDDLPEDYWPEGGSRWFQIVANMLDDPEDPFWDIKGTPDTETEVDILERSMVEARSELIELLGNDSSKWRWGDLHTATFENQTLGQSGIAPVEWLFNRAAPNRVAGGPSIVDAVGWEASEGYEVNWVPSMRMVVDLSDLSASTSVHTTGQSGHAFNGHYADMIDMWVDGDQHPMLWTLDQVEEAATNTLTLVPGS